MNTMAEYDNSNIKIIGIDYNVGIDIPEPIALINFDAFHAGTYIVNVQEDGSYYATFVGTRMQHGEVEK